MTVDPPPSPVPPPPEAPDPAECCGRGCDPCIFDYYDRALRRWEDQIRAMGLNPAQVQADRQT
ncbi:MAG TPA: oxidoreductase-like domain-containing protein [Caulobacteraceae bacterium]|nr:oxidoreductase-like domain-containing protein [Caulobacteraceae bacterium]